VREVLKELMGWWEAGATVGVGTVVGTWRSAPRQPGASMLVGPGGEAVGSVSGGCVEGAVYELGQEVVASGTPVLQRYGISDDDAFAVGLTCGGILDVYVEKVSKETFPELGAVTADIEAGRPVAVATVIEHPDRAWLGRRLVVHPEEDETAGAGREAGGSTGGGAPRGSAYGTSLGSPRADSAVIDDARGLLAHGTTGLLTYGPDGERRGEGMRVFVQSYAPKPRMLVFGAIDFAAAIARVGSFLGYHVTVCDARPIFATKTRFPEADEVIVRWPHEYLQEEADAGRIDPRTVLCVLTHDPKFDVPVLQIALRLPPVAYIGAMGSRRTHEDRLDRLREVGLTEDELARMSSPIGLDLGARTPEETAISIAAEIILDRWGGGGERLTDLSGPIHHHHPAHDHAPS
jgi:xanthine dehydrogenase accessory factor